MDSFRAVDFAHTRCDVGCVWWAREGKETSSFPPLCGAQQEGAQPPDSCFLVAHVFSLGRPCAGAAHVHVLWPLCIWTVNILINVPMAA